MPPSPPPAAAVPAAAVLMIQGCASSVGKSLIVAGLCRLFHRRGLRVAPFKAQNMALNSYVTEDGLELGRSTAVQAEAAGVEPTVDMNPVLLKPESDAGSQVVLLGKPVSRADAVVYSRKKEELRSIVATSLARLRSTFDLVVIEGAGSPAEINLRDKDIVNMHVARLANAPVLLVGDIDRGGVFAHLVGTLELLAQEERELVAGFVINKFRGDERLLEPGLAMLEQRTGLPVVGVVPWMKDLRIAEEDSVALDQRDGRRAGPGELDIAVVRLPRISNYDDFLALEHEPGVVVRYVERPEDLEGADLAILPGTKNTRADLAWLRTTGFAAAILRRAELGEPVLGICGGYQMLGRAIDDPHGAEGPAGSEVGLGLLPIATAFEREKTTRRVRLEAIAGSANWLAPAAADPADGPLTGYEIHMGRVALEAGAAGLFRHMGSGELEGAQRGAASGTLVHGLLENESVRAALLAHLRRAPAVPRQDLAAAPRTPTAEYERLADTLEASLDMELLEQLLYDQGCGMGRWRDPE